MMALILQPAVKIPLTQGKAAVISELDFPRVIVHSWAASFMSRGWYALGNTEQNGKRKGCSLHRFLTGFPPYHVDHANGDGLDNRRSNLRAATKSQNAQNSRLKPHKFKGVTYDKKWKRFYARIGVNGKNIRLGGFATAKEAAMAYNKAAAQHFAQFARLNQIPT